MRLNEILTTSLIRCSCQSFSKRRSWLLSAACILVVLNVCVSVNAQTQNELDFARDIRPILSENCSFCHGPDEQQREADLRLDTSDGAWSVLEKGNSSESELYRRIIATDQDLLMPPPDSNRQLTKEQIETLRMWIDQGAGWEQHWSYRPIHKPPVPEMIAEANRDSKAPIRNPIDAFVQKRLEQSPLAPSPEASRETLIRRLSLDLTGLPPTPEHTQEFLADYSSNAYENLVDRLLNSQHFGQRMAWDWLDAARYADTNGYQGDQERTMWPWRDWVVDAFNQNLPYDQFTLWQIAGDLLPDATHQQKLATAFNRNHMINGEGGRIAEENRVEYVMDMTETMGTVWLGMTLNCCRCHDHKYDPILNKEYYQFFAFFNQTSVNGGGGNAQTPPVLASPATRQRREVEKLESERKLQSKLQAERERKLQDTQEEWEQFKLKHLAESPDWLALKAVSATAKNALLRVLEDGSIIAQVTGEDSSPANNDTYTVTVDLPEQQSSRKIATLRLDVLRHARFADSLSHADSGNFVLTEFTLRVVGHDGQPTRENKIKIAEAKATYEQGSHAVTSAFDGNPSTGWAVYDGKRVDKDHAAIFRFQPALELTPAERIEITLAHDSPHAKHNIGRFLLSITDDATLGLAETNRDLLVALQTDPPQRTGDQRKLIAETHQNEDSEFRQIRQAIQDVEKKLQSARNAWPKVMVMEDQKDRRKTFLLERGLYNQPKDEVQAGFPVSLLQAAPTTVSSQTQDEPLNRLDLAKWLVHPDHPLTARVTVNRFWQQFFGTGLVETTEDFGTQGETPEHLDLLNWLAKKFIESEWNVKELIKMMVMSHTYRQSSVISSQATYDLDPSNRLLSRASRYRLPAWMIRDQALASSGLMSAVNEGASVNTYQPAGVWEEASFGKKQYRQDSGEKLYRRSLYVFWRRIIAPTMFFDNASRQTCTVRTGRTNTPLHALQTLNGTIYVEAARQLATWGLQQSLEGDEHAGGMDQDSQRIDRIVNRVLARHASEEERKIFHQGLQRSRERFTQQPESALAFLAVGETARNDTLDACELAAWSSLCLAVLNLDETLNRE